MSGEKTIDDFLDQLIQTKVSLRHLIEDYQDEFNHKLNINALSSEERYKHNQSIFILKFKYDQLDMIQSEIRYLTADNIKNLMNQE